MARATAGRTYIWERGGWPGFTFDLARLAVPLAGARRAQGELLGMVKVIDQVAANEAAVSAMAGEVVNNSAIEGVNLDMESVRASMLLRLGIETGLTQVSGDRGRRVDPVVGVLAEAVQGFKDSLTLERIFVWHRAIFPKGVPDGMTVLPAGRLRGNAPMVVATLSRRPEEPEIVHFEAPGREGLEREVDAFLHWFNEPPKDLDGLMRAGIAHLWFVTIHPLDDGNGRIARTITDLALSQDERVPRRFYSLSVQIMVKKGNYYDALEHAQRGSLDITEWLIWFLSQVEAAASRGAWEVARVLARSRFWATANRFKLNERQEKVLQRVLSPTSKEDVVSNSYYRKIVDTTRPTATRDLAELAGLGLLVPFGAGRSSSYRVDLERFLPDWLSFGGLAGKQPEDPS